MQSSEMNSKITSSLKWSSITEILIKFIVPITNMIMARILAPDAFGVVATATMVTSFADVFTDAGFQKYLIQKEFSDEEELYKNATVAFWTNFTISVIIWCFIATFSESIASLVGNHGLGNVITIAALSIILTSFSSIQIALYKKQFDFKTLFKVRIIGVFTPFITTIPLALCGFDYWSIIIGTITTNLVNAILLTWHSKWKPNFYYSIKRLRVMFNYSMWMLFDSILTWLTAWIGTFIVAKYLSNYYIGLYKNSMSTANSILNIITAATSPVLLSALAKLKNDSEQYNNVLYGFQSSVSLFLTPLGFGIFMYKEFFTQLTLGENWIEASNFIGLWCLMCAITIPLTQYIIIVFQSKEMPKLSVVSQGLHLMFLIPVLFLAGAKGFNTLVIVRSLSRMQYVIVTLVLVKLFVKIPVMTMLKNIAPAFISSIIMSIVAYFLKDASGNLGWTIISIIISSIVYGITILLFPSVRNRIRLIFNKNVEMYM